MSEQLSFYIEPQYDNMQAKRYLKQFCGLSTRLLTRLKEKPDGITMNGSLLRTVDPVKAGQTVIINLPNESSEYIEPIKGDLEVLYEDNFILAVNKPPFMPVHPVKQHKTDTLANIVIHYMEHRGESYVFRAHNRLDRDTSGIVVIAKDKFTINKLKNNVSKTYTAIVHGKIESAGSVIKPIGLPDGSNIVRQVLECGKPAITHYQPVAFNDAATLLRVKLETGKTHQIRCHMSYLGHPLIGDDLYGGTRELINRQALHCGEVELIHPVSNKKISLKSQLPVDMRDALIKIKIPPY